MRISWGWQTKLIGLERYFRSVKSRSEKKAVLPVKKAGPNGCERCYFFRYTLSPIFSCRFGMVTFPSVEAMIIVLPVEEGPNSFERSTLIVNIDPSTLISTFFIIAPFQWHEGSLLCPRRSRCAVIEVDLWLCQSRPCEGDFHAVLVRMDTFQGSASESCAGEFLGDAR